MKKLLYLIKPPCGKCPYKLGRVKFVDSPCPMCKLNDYRIYEMLVEVKYRPTAIVINVEP